MKLQLNLVATYAYRRRVILSKITAKLPINFFKVGTIVLKDVISSNLLEDFLTV